MDPSELTAFVRELLLPPTALLVLAMAGFLLALRARLRTAGIVLSAAATALLWLLSTPAVSSQLTRWIVPHVPLRADAVVDADAVVILAGGARRYAPEYNVDVPSDVSLQRLAYGARVARRTALPILLSGGRGEAWAMREFLVTDFGLSPQWVEDASRNTRENALLSSAMLRDAGVRTVVLVTSASHMRRAAAEFRLLGLHVITAPVTDYAPPENALAKWLPGLAGLRNARTVAYEALAIALLRWRAGPEALATPEHDAR